MEFRRKIRAALISRLLVAVVSTCTCFALAANAQHQAADPVRQKVCGYHLLSGFGFRIEQRSFTSATLVICC